jgi:hypothetical protein
MAPILARKRQIEKPERSRCCNACHARTSSGASAYSYCEMVLGLVSKTAFSRQEKQGCFACGLGDSFAQFAAESFSWQLMASA